MVTNPENQSYLSDAAGAREGSFDEPKSRYGIGGAPVGVAFVSLAILT